MKFDKPVWRRGKSFLRSLLTTFCFDTHHYTGMKYFSCYVGSKSFPWNRIFPNCALVTFKNDTRMRLRAKLVIKFRTNQSNLDLLSLLVIRAYLGSWSIVFIGRRHGVNTPSRHLNVPRYAFLLSLLVFDEPKFDEQDYVEGSDMFQCCCCFRTSSISLLRRHSLCRSWIS